MSDQTISTALPEVLAHLGQRGDAILSDPQHDHHKRLGFLRGRIPYAFKIVNLGVYAQNLKNLRQISGCGLLLSMKSRFYGNQDTRRSPVLPLIAREAGIAGFCVAGINEARDLRDAGITDRIIILYSESSEGSNLSEAIDLSVELFITSYEDAQALSHCVLSARQQSRDDSLSVKIHVFADTGMSRGGFPVRNPAELEKSLQTILSINDLPGLTLTGLAMHFAAADAADVASAREHFGCFLDMLKKLYQSSGTRPFRPREIHVANSAAMLQLPETMDIETYRQAVGDGQADFRIMIRPGITTTGAAPSDEVLSNLNAAGKDLPCTNIVTYHAKVSEVITLHPGQEAGYSAKYKNETDEVQTLALIAAGYSDGIQRILAAGQQLPVLINGQIYRTVGARTSMNSFFVKSENPASGVRKNDLAVLVGGQGEGYIPLTEWEAAYGTIPYEVMLRLQLPMTYYALPTDEHLYLYDEPTGSLIASTSLRLDGKGSPVYCSTGTSQARFNY